MTDEPTHLIELSEYGRVSVEPNEIPDEAADRLWRQFDRQVDVEYPSPRTNQKWTLTANGWVGYIPLPGPVDIALRPKTRVKNLFRMLEYAYQLESFQFLEGHAESDTLGDVYERLAHILSKRILARGRRGLYKTYLPQKKRLSYVRGRMDMRNSMRRPWKVKPHCHYRKHTPDVEENQILAWTLLLISRIRFQRARTMKSIRRAFQQLRGGITVRPFGPSDCVGRTYNRLNEDYRSLHALCRFFLEHSGPTVNAGDQKMLPFLVSMPQLYESFVAAWLDQNLPHHLRLEPQERYNLGNTTYFKIDLVLYSAESLEPICVPDTKYKAPRSSSGGDISQVVTYALAKGCRDAFLVYPTPLEKPVDEVIGDIRVRSTTFSLAGDLETAGNSFLRSTGYSIVDHQAGTRG